MADGFCRKACKSGHSESCFFAPCCLFKRLFHFPAEHGSACLRGAACFHPPALNPGAMARRPIACRIASRFKPNPSRNPPFRPSRPPRKRQHSSCHAGRSASGQHTSGQRAPCQQRTLRGRPTHPYRPCKPPFRPSAARLPPWPSPARWPRNCRQRPAWAQAQQVAGQQASQEKTGIHKRVSLRNMPKGRARGTAGPRPSRAAAGPGG